MKSTIRIDELASQADVPLDAIYDVMFDRPVVPQDLRERITDLMNEAGTLSIPGVGIWNIGVLVPGRLPDEYAGQMVAGVLAHAQQMGYGVLVNVQHRSLDPVLGEGGCHGVVVLVPDKEVMDAIRYYRREYVLLDDERDEAPSVVVDNRRAIQGVMGHLTQRGHRRIGFIAGSMSLASARQRYQGYLDGLETVGVAFDDRLIMVGDGWHESGYRHAQALLQLADPPTAIVANNDFMAMGAIEAAAERGLRVGTDVAITGFDDVPMAQHVGLTTVRQPAAEMGAAALDMLLLLLQDCPLPALHQRFGTELIVRHSTAAA